MLSAIESIEEFMEGNDQNQYLKDIKLQSAVQWQFLVIGEAVRHVDHEVLDKYNYPWHVPRTFRNFITHGYHEIKPERIYHATTDLAPLKEVLQTILANEF